MLQEYPVDHADELFQAAAHTVQTASVQFEELKQTADQMLQYAMSLDRQYFTPSEDEAAHQILVTYWQLRCALLDLILELRQRAERRREDYARLFLPGYAGGLILLDAARFLRDRFHGRYWLRQRLNDPEPSFGIPAGIYDATQRSWSSRQHMWLFFKAAKYYHQHRDELQLREDQADIQPLLEIIGRLSRRLKIGWTDFTTARIRFRFRQLRSFFERDLWGSSMYQLQKLAGCAAADRYVKLGHCPGLPLSVRQQFEGLLQPGDILLVRKEFALTNYFLPGYWPHAALFVGSSQTLRDRRLHQHPQLAARWSSVEAIAPASQGLVMEAMKDGVRLRKMDSPFASDSVVVLRPTLSPASIDRAITRAIFHAGKDYDFSFDFTRSDRLVCTEVVYRAYEGLEGVCFPLQPRVGRLTLAAADLLELALQNNPLCVAAAYIPKLYDQVLRGNRAAIEARHVADCWARNLPICRSTPDEKLPLPETSD